MSTRPSSPASRLKTTTDRLIKRFGFQLIQVLERLVVRYSPHGDPTFFDPGDFPWARRLEADWRVIRRELDDVLAHRDALPNFQDISEDQKALTTDDRWKTFFLYGFGYKAEANCARVPRTTEIVEQIPGMKTAFFSILAPGKKIPPHRGPYKGVMRCHLGLKVPEPAERCWIRVGNDVAHWEEGEVLLFDDTHEHEVHNDTGGERVVLFLDVERPLNPPMGAVNRFLLRLIALSPFVQNARANQEEWEAALADRKPAATES
jgi:beta-hydroxylase